jgi:hypothetical protein
MMKTRLGATRQGKMTLLLAVLLLAGSIYVVAAHAKHQGPTPIYTTSTNIPDPNVVGNINQAVQQTQQLVTALTVVNFDPSQLPDYTLLVLPDAQYAEDEPYQEANVASYVIPDGSIPEQNGIACYTGIYARQNTSYYAGDTSSSAPSGSFIVGWKNGTVQTIPVSQMRMMTDAAGEVIECFPGMAG